MSTNNKTTRGPVATLLIPTQNLALLMFARSVHGAMLNNPAFPNPNPPLDQFEANIDAFEDAEMNAGTRARGAAEHRNVKKKVVKEDLFHLCDYVQSIVEKNANPVVATDLIKSAFMSVRKTPKRKVPDVSAKNGDVSGQVMLAARTVASVAMYYWEYSSDQLTWTPIPESLLSRTVVSGLTSATVYYFRFRAHTRAGRQDYSQVVSLLVH